MNLNKQFFWSVLLLLCSLFSSAQIFNVEGSCLTGTSGVVAGADPDATTMNSRPVYYNPAVPLYYEDSAFSFVYITVRMHIFYTFLTLEESGLPSGGYWVIALDGQPYYYRSGSSSTPTSGVYTAFDTGAPMTACGGSVNLFERCSPTSDTTTHTACGAFTWPVNGQTYTTSGTYTHVIPSTATPAACPAGSTTNGCSTGREYIDNVTFGTTINNTSACSASGNYQDFTSISEAVVAGSAYPISISNANSFFGDRVYVWADWNHDGDFDDANETYPLVYTHTSPNSGVTVVTSGSIAVPAGAFNGATRLRVRLGQLAQVGFLKSCGDEIRGEVEDYTLNVSGGVDSPCSTYATLVLTVNPIPAGDTFATAIDASGLTFTTTGNNLASNCYSNTFGNASEDVWYRVTLDNCAGSLTVDTSGANTNFDTFVRVYATDGTTQLGSDDNSGTGAASLAVVDVSAHDVVYVLVEGFGANTGTYDLALSQTILSTVPTFTQVDPICSGGSLTLATTSDNGITGSWAPAIDNTATTTYTFTPDAGQCIAPTLTTMTVVVNPGSTNTTTVSACDTYTWANNGQTYTASGTYTGTTTNCVTEELVLTITPGAFNTTTITACDTYTWSNNGQTYTASGTYTGTTTNCVTEQLVLTITPSSVNTTTVTACDSYTWAANGQTYTASGTYTGTTTNCVTEELVLTITPSSTNTTTASACDSYTWANNGQTYTASGTYTGTTTNCVTEELVLTITPSSVNTTTATACDSYTWAANGQTYTTSGTYTGTTANCVTDQLVLTINNSTTNGSLTTSAVNSYTWNGPLGSGLTYTTSGVYTFTTTNAAGCPNVATLNLTITTGVVTVNTFNIGTSCGATISNLAVTIIAAAVPGATTYTFRITNMNTNVPFVVNRPVNSFALYSYAGITLGTPYQIEVSVNGGANYGAPCIVNTPTPTSTIGAQCGTTVATMNTFVYATYVSVVTGYRFRVTNLTTSGVQVYDALAGQNRFTFNQLSAAIRANSTTYTVEVALRNTDGTYLPYGTACNITTPAFPTSEIVLAQCDTVATSNTQTFNAVVVSGATGYRFQLTNSGLGYSFSVDRPLASYNLSMFPDLVAGTTYTVRVAVRIAGVWGALTGKPCNMTTPGIASGGERVMLKNNDFAAITYPNPFTESFMFDVKTSVESRIQVRVYDMLGKQVENRTVEVSEINTIQIGSSYPSGVYNVIVSQGENTQTLRVIKR